MEDRRYNQNATLYMATQLQHVHDGFVLNMIKQGMHYIHVRSCAYEQRKQNLIRRCTYTIPHEHTTEVQS
jgi:hypothetical protein